MFILLKEKRLGPDMQAIMTLMRIS